MPVAEPVTFVYRPGFSGTLFYGSSAYLSGYFCRCRFSIVLSDRENQLDAVFTVSFR